MQIVHYFENPIHPSSESHYTQSHGPGEVCSGHRRVDEHPYQSNPWVTLQKNRVRKQSSHTRIYHLPFFLKYLSYVRHRHLAPPKSKLGTPPYVYHEPKF